MRCKERGTVSVVTFKSTSIHPFIPVRDIHTEYLCHNKPRRYNARPQLLQVYKLPYHLPLAPIGRTKGPERRPTRLDISTPTWPSINNIPIQLRRINNTLPQLSSEPPFRLYKKIHTKKRRVSDRMAEGKVKINLVPHPRPRAHWSTQILFAWSYNNHFAKPFSTKQYDCTQDLQIHTLKWKKSWTY